MAMSSGQGAQVEGRGGPGANGAAMAAILAAGIGAFAMGLFVILHEAGWFSAPSLYRPSGGLSGRVTFALVAWGIAWAIAHRAWRGRAVDAGRVFKWALVLVAIGLLATFPPGWKLLGGG